MTVARIGIAKSRLGQGLPGWSPEVRSDKSDLFVSEKAGAALGQLLVMEAENQRLEAEILAFQKQRRLGQVPRGKWAPQP